MTLKEALSKITAESLLKAMDVDKSRYEMEVTENHMDSDCDCFISIYSLIEEALENYLMDSGVDMTGVYISGRTDWDGGRRYYTHLCISDRTGQPPMIWEFVTKSESYREFAEEVAEEITAIASRKVPATVRLNFDSTIDLKKVLGDVTQDEVASIHKFLNDYRSETEIIRMIHEKVNGRKSQ